MTHAESTPTDVHLDEVERHLDMQLPRALRALYLTGDGRYRSDGEWWVVWPLDRLVQDNTTAWAEGTLSRELIAFGDDGTGNPFCVPSDGRDEVVRWSRIDSDVEANEGTLAHFVSEWVPARS